MGAHRIVQAGCRNLSGQLRRYHMARATRRIFGIIIIPAISDDFGDAQGAIPQNCGGQLASLGKGFDHNNVRHRRVQLWRRVRAIHDQVHPNRRSFGIWFNHIGWRHHMARTDIAFGRKNAVNDRQTIAAVNFFRPLLVHRQRRRQNARMRIRDMQPF